MIVHVDRTWIIYDDLTQAFFNSTIVAGCTTSSIITLVNKSSNAFSNFLYSDHDSDFSRFEVHKLLHVSLHFISLNKIVWPPLSTSMVQELTTRVSEQSEASKPWTRVFLGPKYMSIRWKEFRAHRAPHSPPQQAPHSGQGPPLVARVCCMRSSCHPQSSQYRHTPAD